MACVSGLDLPERGHQRPFLIGVSGGTASGKFLEVNATLFEHVPAQQTETENYLFPAYFSKGPEEAAVRNVLYTVGPKSTVCEKIMELLGQNEVDHRQRKVVILSQDRFYKVLTPDQKARAIKGQYNFDHPDAFDNDLMHRTLTQILDGQIVDVPTYDFITHSRLPETTTVYPADVLLFEGILAFYNQDIRDMFQLKLFVDTDSDVRLSRRVLRDMKRGRDLEQILTQYTTFVKPAFEEFCLPTKKYADVIIPRGVDNMVAINLIVQHIQDILNGDICKWQRGVMNGRSQKRTFPGQGEPAGVLVPGKRTHRESSSRPH